MSQNGGFSAPAGWRRSIGGPGAVEPLRQRGAYAAIIESGSASAAPVADELLGYLGRDPRA
ncbi:hypothetical protein [Nocardia sp. SYP-A9097]|uniref:hypothetical protein n=1 Tax=Nocardia sp. SYP-A9097 TaxID=2663237 RepID=UPI00129B5B37|nr:hypothetical protein [Nocardia sp. SYP-A9097]